MWFDLFGQRTVIAEWASIVAVFVSAYAAYAITRVRSQILGRVRLPVLVSALEKNAKNFASLMRDYETSKDEFGLELAKCEANLKLIGASIKGRPKTTVRLLLRSIRRYNGRGLFHGGGPRDDRNSAWGIYRPLNGLIEELKNTVEEQRYGG
jgi:hypothetical protein